MDAGAPVGTHYWPGCDSGPHTPSLSLVHPINCCKTTEHTTNQTIKARSVFSVRAGSEPAPQTNSLSQPHSRYTTADSALRATLGSQLQRKSAMRSKQLQHLLHLGHTPIVKQAKGNWQPHSKPTITARKQRSVQLPVGIHSAELNRSALSWVDPIKKTPVSNEVAGFSM